MNTAYSQAIPKLSLCTMIATLLVCGCGGGSDFAPEEAPDLDAEFALETKHGMLLIVETSRRNPERAQDVYYNFAEAVQAYESQHTGDHEQVYADISQILTELESNFDQPEKLDQLEELANQLPGDVAAYRKELAEMEN